MHTIYRNKKHDPQVTMCSIFQVSNMGPLDRCFGSIVLFWFNQSFRMLLSPISACDPIPCIVFYRNATSLHFCHTGQDFYSNCQIVFEPIEICQSQRFWCARRGHKSLSIRHILSEIFARFGTGLITNSNRKPQMTKFCGSINVKICSATCQETKKVTLEGYP